MLNLKKHRMLPVHVMLVVGFLIVGLSIALTATRPAQAAANFPNGFKSIAYSTSWSGSATSIQYSKITHINYAFASYTSDGTLGVPNASKLQQVVSLAHQNGVKVLISIGGWSGTSYDATFEALAGNATSRNNFINNAMNIVSQYSLDGVDIDWEYPTIAANYTALMQGLRTNLNSRFGVGAKLLTTAVVSSGSGANAITSATYSSIDFFNVMAYDGGSPHANYQWSIDSFNYWVNTKGVPVSKVVLGVPFYSRPGGVSYSTFVSQNPANAQVDCVNNDCYNGIPTIQRKTQYVMDRGGGGIMYWEVANDTTDQYSLVNAIYVTAMGGGTPPPTTPPAGQAPYGGTRWAIPGTVQAENYDTGGEGVAYHDTETANQGGAYRADGVDIEATTDSGGGNNVGWTATDEWLKYSVNVTTGGTYTLSARTASQSGGGSMHVEIDGANVTGAMSIPSTGAWQTWTTVTSGSFSLTSGQHIMRIAIDAAGFNLNWVSLAGGGTPPPTTPPPTTPPPPGQAPYGGTPAAIPGTVQAENYDTGGEGVAYHDTETANQGGVYRTDGVDIQATTDTGGGNNVGWTAAGEWLEYTVNVQASGPYTLNIRAASQAGGGSLHVEIDGANVTGAVAIPSTGAWQTWTTVTRAGISLPAGQHIMRIAIDAAGFNLNWVSFVPGPPPPSSNVALGKPATSSSNETTAFTPNLAVDGNTGTRWSSAFSDPQWIRIDLGATYSISRVVLRWEAAFGRAYQIQTSADGTTWTTIYSTTTGDGAVDDLTISGSGRYIRMYGTARGTAYGYSLYEFEVYGS